jgi:hypothetical protein
MRTKARPTDKVCLRCDWHGDHAARTCPSCGAALWVPRRETPLKPPSRVARARARLAERAQRRAAIVSGIQAVDAATHGDDEATLDEVERRNRRRGWIPAIVVVCVAIVAIAIVRSGSPATPVLADTAIIGGRLLYVEREADGQARMWVWNLETGVVEQGPRIDDPIELVDASDAGAGRVAIVAHDPDVDGQVAELLRHLDPTDVAVPYVRGRFATWAPGGQAADAIEVTEGPETCPLAKVRSYTASNGHIDTVWGGRLCGRVVGMERSPAYLFVSLKAAPVEGELGPVVRSLGITGFIREAIPGMRAIASTRASDLFLVPGAASISPTVWGFEFGDPTSPVAYRDGRERLVVERFLADTSKGDGIYVLGTMNGEHGVYRVPGLSAYGQKTPELVYRTDAEDVEVAETNRQVPLILVSGQVYVVGSDEAKPLTLPDGAPPVTGPILWINRDEGGG